RLGHGVGYDAPAGVVALAPGRELPGAVGDGQIDVPGDRQIAYRAPVDPAPDGFELVDDLQRPGFGRTGQRSGREGRAQNVDGRGPGFELTADGRADVHDVAVADDVHELADVDRPGGAHLRQVVAGQIDEHEVFGAFLLVGQQRAGQGVVGLRGGPARTGACDRVCHDLAGADGDEGLGRGSDDARRLSRIVMEVEQVHEGARVRMAQHPVDAQRLRRARG